MYKRAERAKNLLFWRKFYRKMRFLRFFLRFWQKNNDYKVICALRANFFSYLGSFSLFSLPISPLPPLPKSVSEGGRPRYPPSGYATAYNKLQTFVAK